MMPIISDEEWAALPEEEKQKRRQQFELRLREVLAHFDIPTRIAALESMLKELENERL